MTLSFMVSTADNPYHPFTQPEDWYDWDVRNGYNTMGYIARLVPISPALEETGESDSLTESAMHDILRLNLTGNYIMVKNPEFSENNIEK